MSDAIVISSAGVVSGYGAGLATLARGLRSGTRNFTPWSAMASVQAAAVPVCAAPVDGVPGHSRSTQLALLAAREAFAPLSAHEREASAIILGGTTGGMALTEAVVLDPPHASTAGFTEAVARAHPVSDATNAIAAEAGAYGPRATIVSACSSGLNAIITARRWIEAGMASAVMAVGVDGLSRLTVAGFGSLAAVDPLGTRPFARDRKGLTIGEGAGAFYVERETSARRAGRPVLARLLGSAIVAEAFHATQPEPSGAGAERAMRQALADAGLSAAAVDVVSAHGTGTAQNDAMECKALARVFGRGPAVSSQKSQLGHTLGAAGAVEVAACLVMLAEQVVFPTHGLSEDALDPACADVAHVMGAPEAREISVILKNSFAFGGQNSALCLGVGDKGVRSAQ